MNSSKIQEQINAILQDDEFGLLVDSPSKSKTQTISENQRLIDEFSEINEFYIKFNRPPQRSGGINEKRLAMRLGGYTSDKISILKEFDEFNLLQEKKEIKTVDDILADDDLGLLDSKSDSIFSLKFVKEKVKEIATADYVARRKPCNEFDLFEDKFKQCHNDLKSRDRKLNRFVVGTIMKKGDFFVLKGMLAYVAEVGEMFIDKWNRDEARLRVIFENGTESDMLMRSLGKVLNKDGKTVSDKLSSMLDGFNNITEEDEEAGYIYILKSKSNDERIAVQDDLYKIGFSTTKVEDRIKNAEKEPTYLMAPVEIVASYKCFNMNTQKFELLLHKFFADACLNLDIFDDNGQRHSPREWFVVPLDVINEAINLIISKEIINYKYNNKSKNISIK